MSLQQIGFALGPQGLERLPGRLDKPASHATAATTPRMANDDPAGRAGIARGASAFNRLTARDDRAHAVAMRIRTEDQTMATVGTTVGVMKKHLEVILKNYPPFPPGSQERVQQLKRYAGLRAMIDRLTVPPEKFAQQDADRKEVDALLPDKYGFIFGSDGMTRTVPKEEIHIGPSGIYIPQLPASGAVDDAAIGKAIGQLDQAGEAIQARREALQAYAFAMGGSGDDDRQMSEQRAGQTSVRLGEDLAAQPVGIAHKGTKQLHQLLGQVWP